MATCSFYIGCLSAISSNMTTNVIDLIGTTDAAKLLGLTRQGLQRRIAQGKLTPTGKLSGTRGPYLFDRSQILALANEGESQ